MFKRLIEPGGYMQTKVSLNNLKDEITQIRKRYTMFKDDSAFVFWFLTAYIVKQEEIAKRCLTGKEGGRGGEKNIDAIYIDEKAHQCNIIQGKFHANREFSEKRSDILDFAYLGTLPWAHKSILEKFYVKLDPIALEKFREVTNLVRSKKYALKLFYVTTAKCGETVVDEAKERVRQAEGNVDISVITYKQVLHLYKQYISDITPHIPPLKLRIVSEEVIQHEGLIHRYDPKSGIESWVLSICGYDIGDMYEKVGDRIFAKNIRGWLGSDTDINSAIAATITKEPSNFWYYNNGITIVCDDARRETQAGEDVIIVDGAQIINGQQTTRTLQKHDAKSTSVIVKIVKIPRDPENDEEYDRLVNSIVRATNWQNYISPSDLVSNDDIQIYLERELRKFGYQYIRKKMTKSEARRLYGQGFHQIDKRELAQAVAACLFDPVIVRKGKEGLFEDPYYKSVFSSRALSFYLSKYWLMREVQYAGYGYPARAYAKWLVLSFAWHVLGGTIGSGQHEKKFRYACAADIKSITSPLYYVLVDIFKAALKFYRLKRGKGEKAKDVSVFFLTSRLDEEFMKFWGSNKNPYRKRVAIQLKRFRNKLECLEIEA